MKYKLKFDDVEDLTREIVCKFENSNDYVEKENIYKELLFMALEQGITDEEFNEHINSIYELNDVPKESENPILLLEGLSQDMPLLFVLLSDLVETIRLHKLSRNEIIELLQEKTDDLRLEIDSRLSTEEIKLIIKSYMKTYESLLNFF